SAHDIRTAVVGLRPGDLGLERDAGAESVGAVERGAPKLLGVDAADREAEEAADYRRALAVVTIEALEAERPGIDGVAAAHRYHIGITLARCGRRRVAGVGVVLVVRTGEAGREVAEADLQTSLVPRRPLVVPLLAGRGVLSKGPLAATAEGQAQAVE